jgi:ribosomal protein S18 acetylase RimI-like enzyme
MQITEHVIIIFFDSLGEERKTFRLSLDEVLKSEMIVIEEIGGEIAGMAGIRKPKMFPVLFIVVKSSFQGKGLGKRLLTTLHDLAKTKYSFIILSVIKGNIRAINLFKKSGYIIFAEKDDFYFMVKPFNCIGILVSKLLKLAGPIITLFASLKLLHLHT